MRRFPVTFHRFTTSVTFLKLDALYTVIDELDLSPLVNLTTLLLRNTCASKVIGLGLMKELERISLQDVCFVEDYDYLPLLKKVKRLTLYNSPMLGISTRLLEHFKASEWTYFEAIGYTGKGRKVSYPSYTCSTYKGEWKDGVPNGYGVIKTQYYHYTGYFKDSKREGFGREYQFDGTAYEGEWSGGLKHGKGKLFKYSQLVYEGEWVNGS